MLARGYDSVARTLTNAKIDFPNIVIQKNDREKAWLFLVLLCISHLQHTCEFARLESWATTMFADMVMMKVRMTKTTKKSEESDDEAEA